MCQVYFAGLERNLSRSLLDMEDWWEGLLVEWKTLGLLHVNAFELLGKGISLPAKSEFQCALTSFLFCGKAS